MQEFQHFSIRCCGAQVDIAELAVLAITEHNSSMETVRATDLKNRLGEVLAKARLHPVAIERHGKVVAYLSPVPAESPARTPRAAKRRPQMARAQEERLVDLCASADLRPSRW